MPKMLSGAAAACLFGAFMLTSPAEAGSARAPGVYDQQLSTEISAQRRRYRRVYRRYVRPRVYAYPYVAPYYRPWPYYYRPYPYWGPGPFFPLGFGFGWGW